MTEVHGHLLQNNVAQYCIIIRIIYRKGLYSFSLIQTSNLIAFYV